MLTFYGKRNIITIEREVVKMYYWKIKFDNGKIEYWESKQSCYNFMRMKGEPKIKYAKPITKIVYLFCKWYYKQSFTVTLN